jgi:hypothetical protein
MRRAGARKRNLLRNAHIDIAFRVDILETRRPPRFRFRPLNRQTPGNLIPTTTMERLPIELVTQILSYIPKEELKVIGFISSKYRSLVIPFLFRRIRPWPRKTTRQGISDLIACLQNNHHLSSVVRALDAEGIRDSAEDLQRIMEITARWGELALPASNWLPIAVFGENTKSRLRRLRCTGYVGSEFPRLLEILPACTNLLVLEIPQIGDKRFESLDPAGLVAAKWVNRLEKYTGPLYPLNYLRSGTPLYHLETTTKVPLPMLQKLGQLLGQQLLALHVHLTVDPHDNMSYSWINYLSPSPIPSLFPNLQYVAWFMVKSELWFVPDDIVRTF